MAANPRDVLLRPLVTEKTAAMMQENRYSFEVPLTANKVEIRQAVEKSFAAKRRAAELLEAAKHAVEIAIEDSEAAAFAYLAEFS